MRKLILSTRVLLRWRTICTLFITRGINLPQYYAHKDSPMAPTRQRNTSNAACLVRRVHRRHPYARSVADRQCSLLMNAAEYYRALPTDESLSVSHHHTIRMLTEASAEGCSSSGCGPEPITTRGRMRVLSDAYCGEAALHQTSRR